ncbi:MAG TPA: hypothetical protein VE974_29725 [Thermoanaerobaculia bacterium]|nr:hypothetical protein [Thermoanaerobaculia bacterium]
MKDKESCEAKITAHRQSVDRGIRLLVQEMEHEHTLRTESPRGRVERVLTIYKGVRPLLAVLGTLPILPSPWRAAVVRFDRALQALALSARDFTPGFPAANDFRRTS